MELLFAAALLLSLVIILEFERRRDANAATVRCSHDLNARHDDDVRLIENTFYSVVAEKWSDIHSSTIIGNVMDKLSADDDNDANLFAKDPEEVDAQANDTNPIPAEVAPSSGEGTSTTLDLTNYLQGHNTKPLLLRDFDTANDRLLVVAPGDGTMPALTLRHTAHGTPVMCCGSAKVALFPGLKGSGSIDTIVI